MKSCTLVMCVDGKLAMLGKILVSVFIRLLQIEEFTNNLTIILGWNKMYSFTLDVSIKISAKCFTFFLFSNLKHCRPLTLNWNRISSFQMYTPLMTFEEDKK